MPESLQTNTSISHYRILSRIGAGGMGEVYLAEDTKLRRKVALKLLSGDLTKNADRLRRFEQEAQAASALNHPNILVIYEIGAEGDIHFIATEFIEGETLRQHTHRTRMSIRESLDIATQVAGALSAAHQAGIIHRDIKPENVMIRPDGYVKVLDFGLAKLTEQQAFSTDTEAPTIAKANTGPGTVMGTINYMSPEQARGKPIDARSDIFSLGVVIYEMIAGRAPFEAETPSDVMSFILHKEPPPMARYSPDVSAELERIVTKTLAKDKEERYQTAKDLLIDLKRLKQKQEIEAELERSVSPDTISGGPSASTSSGTAVATAMDSAGRGGEAAIRTASSAEYIVTGIKRHKIAALSVVLIITAAIVGVMSYLHARNTEVAIESIAVLPFDNQSRDPDTDYLSDGITESIINRLTRIQDLRVIARSTVFRYKGKETDPIAVGKGLGVRAVLAGRLLRRGDQLTASAELIDVRDNKQIWGEQYTRKVADALAVQQEISREIAERLRPTLTGEQRRQLATGDTTNAQAYQFYLRGRYYWNKRTAEGVKKAIEQFQQAIDSDPNYALGYVGLG